MQQTLKYKAKRLPRNDPLLPILITQPTKQIRIEITNMTDMTEQDKKTKGENSTKYVYLQISESAFKVQVWNHRSLSQGGGLLM